MDADEREAFLYVKYVSDVLQKEAKKRAGAGGEGAQSSKPLTRALLFCGHAVQKALCEYAAGDFSSRQGLRQQLQDAVQRTLAAAEFAGHQDPVIAAAAHDAQASCRMAAEAVDRDRQQLLSGELASLHACEVPLPRADTLAQAITMLRSTEVELELHARMALEVQHHVDSSDYSDMNFAYGSTPYSSWLQVVQHTQVAPAVAEAMAAACGRSCIVWGSSLGWLVFYAALTFEAWPCVGYELLTCLHERAVSLQQQLGLQAGTTFVNADMLVCDVSNAGVVLLANQCWDRDLMQQVSRKLAKELPAGAVVIEYGGMREAGSGSAAFKLLAKIIVPVSWNGQQHVYVRQRTGE